MTSDPEHNDMGNTTRPNPAFGRAMPSAPTRAAPSNQRAGLGQRWKTLWSGWRGLGSKLDSKPAPTYRRGTPDAPTPHNKR
ncbi:MAG: hypothetical protein N4A53_11065 [Pelagimonas sp.]|nr:hypothetical protein [Pelagimonas sp.]